MSTATAEKRVRKTNSQYALEALIKGREHLSSYQNWTQGRMHRLREGLSASDFSNIYKDIQERPERYQMCAIGSLYITSQSERVITKASSTLDECAKEIGGFSGIVALNDGGTGTPQSKVATYKRVLKAFDCAIAKLSA